MIKFKNNSEPDIIAENLNKMQQDIGTVVSATEPQGDERLKVWIQKGKNWFNKNDLKITNAWQVTYTIDENKDINIKVSQTGGVCFVGTNSTYLKAGTYTFSATTTGQLSEIRVYNAKDNSQILTNSSNSFTLTLEEDAMIYFQFYVFSTSLSNSLKVSEIQIEQGTGKTSYEAYIEPALYVLNNNNVYEQFMEEEEEEILYEGEKGNIGDVISLNNNSQNYKALIIEGKDGGAIFDSVRIDNANGKKGSLSTITLNEDGSYYFSIQFTIKDDQITVIANYTAVNRSNGYSRYGTNDMKITKVIGIK